jgi:two-component system, LuxR family, sensor kinase FixL
MPTLTWRATLQLLVFAALSLAGNEIGTALRYPDVGAAVLFPPYAILTAALLVVSRREWVWYILADAIAHFITHWPQWSLTWVLLAGVANAARAIAAAALLHRFQATPNKLISIQALALFVVSAAAAAPAIGATIGAADVRLHGGAPTYWGPWKAWFVSNALTGLTMLPALGAAFAFLTGQLRAPLGGRRGLEALLLTLAVVMACGFGVIGGLAGERLALPVYGSPPVLLWAGLRFGTAGASAALTAFTFAAIWSVDRATGSSTPAQRDAGIFTVQLYVVLTAMPVLCLAAIAAGRRRVVELHGALLASLQDHVAILDAGGAVLEVNDSWRRFADAPHARAFHRVRPGDDFLAACRTSADRGDTIAAAILDGVSSVLRRARRRFDVEYDEARDGRFAAYAMSVEALERPDGGAVVVHADATPRRQAQIEIEEQRRELYHLARVRLLGELSGALAHELNQPLAAILSNAEAARRMLRRDPTNVAFFSDVLQDIVADDKRAAAVLQRLATLLKRGDPRPQPIASKDLLDEVLDLARTELLTRRVEASTAIDPDLPAIYCDRVQLQQVFLNLILNACEAMAVTPSADRRLVLAASAEGAEAVHFSVSDRGRGIAPEIVDRLFEPFVTTKPDGLGLGLSISRTIIASHGGRLWGENNRDGGATFHCVLPVADSTAFTILDGAPSVAAGDR